LPLYNKFIAIISSRQAFTSVTDAIDIPSATPRTNNDFDVNSEMALLRVRRDFEERRLPAVKNHGPNK
jgi:hypothetical protein